MKAKIAALIFLFIGSMTLARADQIVERVQQILKEQGFYYGEVTGQMSSDLTAAVRRYQIRSGLQVNGQLNGETLQSLGVNSSGAPQPAATPAPAPALTKNARPSPPERMNGTPAPIQPFPNAPEDQQVYPSRPVVPGGLASGVLAQTPFEAAPPNVQRNVIVSAQIALARRGLYREEINGMYGPAMESSLRAYQARAKIPTTGRLDLETLAALRLLPQPRQPFYDPFRRRWRYPPGPSIRRELVPD
jgi:peptidoglycan hydrolase-like protein with peptidoglycan-binding domain